MMDVINPTAPIKNYITGTTRGLGQALLRRWEIEEPWMDTVGLNRPQYDLSKNINAFVRYDFNTYILNAHYGWSQTDLLYELFEANKDRECQIIVIGSVSADGDRAAVNRYAIEKKALDAACTQLQLVPSRCTITQIKLGRTDTDLIKHIHAPKMDPLEVARAIHDVISFDNKKQYVKTITIDNKG